MAVDPLLIALKAAVETKGSGMGITVLTPGGVIRGRLISHAKWLGLLPKDNEPLVTAALEKDSPNDYLFLTALRLPEGDATAKWLRVPIDQVIAFWYYKD